MKKKQFLKSAQCFKPEKPPMMLVSNGPGEGLWCRVKETVKEEGANDKEIRRQSSIMIANVEKKVEGSLIASLEAQVIDLTKALEGGDEEKNRLRSENSLYQRELQKLRQNIQVHEVESREIKSRASESDKEVNELRVSLNRIQRECDKLRKDLQQSNDRLMENERLYQSEKAKNNEEAEKYEPKIIELSEQLEEYTEAYQNLEKQNKELVRKLLDAKAYIENQQKVPPSPTVSSAEEKPKSKKKEIVKEEKRHDEPLRDQENNENILSGLKKKIAEDVEAKKALREIIRTREETIRKQKDSAEALQKQLELNKTEIQYLQSQLSQKNSQVKSLTLKVNELIQADKSRQTPEDPKRKPKTAVGIVQQKMKQEKLEKVEAKPYLFGPKMTEDQFF